MADLIRQDLEEYGCYNLSLTNNNMLKLKQHPAADPLRMQALTLN